MQNKRYNTFKSNQIEINLAKPMGTAISGKLLMISPIGGNGQLHNYAFIFTLSSFGFLISFLWVLFMIDEQKDKEKFDKQFGEVNVNNLELKDIENQKTENRNENPIKLLFKSRNVKDIVKTCIKKRDNRVRLQIWLVFSAMLSHRFLTCSPGFFEFQFVQKIYFWDAETYGYISFIGTITYAFSTITCAPILIKVFIS